METVKYNLLELQQACKNLNKMDEKELEKYVKICS